MATVDTGPSNGGSEEQQPERIELIAIMGPTGSGKSSFINHILQKGADKAEVGHGVESCTSEVKPMPFQLGHFRGSIIDTPGFDDTYMSDTEVLKGIAAWMELTYREGIMITGVLYLRDISEARMTGTARKNLNMFRKLCGTDSLANVVIVTTKWDIVSDEQAELREEELMTKFLRPMLEGGAKTARHNNTRLTAQEALRKILGNVGVPLKLQHELVEEGKTLGETDAGVAIGEEIAKLHLKHAEELAELRELIEQEKDERKKREYEDDQQRILAQEARADADKMTLEASRDYDVAQYQMRLAEIANQTGESTTSVMMKGLSSGVVSIGPLILEQWQQSKREEAERREEDWARQEEEWRRQEAREDAREARMREDAREREIQARQDKLERGLVQSQQTIAELQADLRQAQLQGQKSPKGLGLFELLFT